MAVKKLSMALMLGATSVGISGCSAGAGASAETSRPSAVESISYEVGPCFGFCPVYNASASSDGRVAFDGVRHTATLGPKSVEIGVARYRAFAEALAPYRPASGTTASTTCDARISDQQHFRIVWTAPDGTKSVLEHDRGCRSARNDALNAALQNAPGQLGIADLARQITRPGASRG